MHYLIRSFYVTFVFSVLVTSFLLDLNAEAETLKLISYRGEIVTVKGVSIDTTVPVQFLIYSDSIGGNPLWTEIQTGVRIAKSAREGKSTLNVLLGSVNQIPDSVYASKTRYLEVKINNGPEIIPRKPISLDVELDGYLPLYNDANSEYLGNYGGVQPRFVKRRAPKYPPLARMSGVTGTVRVEVFIDKDGKVRDARTYMDSGTNAGLEEAAIEAVKGSEFAPATIDGQPVAVRIIVPYHFRLASKK